MVKSSAMKSEGRTWRPLDKAVLMDTAVDIGVADVDVAAVVVDSTVPTPVDAEVLLEVEASRPRRSWAFVHGTFPSALF